MKNIDKFYETFGFYPNKKGCVAPETVCVANAQDCKLCPFNAFWDKEYKEKKENGVE